MTKESRLRLMESKLQVYMLYLTKAAKTGDKEKAQKWEDAYHVVKEDIEKIKEE